MNTDIRQSTPNADAKKASSSKKNILRAVAFLALFALCFFRLQDLVLPNRDVPTNTTRLRKSIHGLLNEARDSLDIIWLGTSHVYAGISPLEIYRNTGIRSHVISGPSLKTSTAYYLLRETFKRQSPRLVFMDVSSMTYHTGAIIDKNNWQEYIDAMPWSNIGTRIDMAKKLAELNGESFNDEYIARSVLPLFQYHTNTALTADEWTDIHLEQVYYRKGFRLIPQIKKVDEESEEQMDELMGYEEEGLTDDDNAQNDEGGVLAGEDDVDALEDDEGVLAGEDEDALDDGEELDAKTNDGDARNGNEEAVSAPDDDVPVAIEENRSYLEQILELCRENGCELVLFKVPVHKLSDYRGHWSLEKHDLFQALADEYGLTFLDLNYEAVGIDWNTETGDSGQHLNLYGATRLSRFVSDWLAGNYDIVSREDEQLKSQWDKQLELYDWEISKYRYSRVEELQAYFEMLNDPSCTVLMSVNGVVSDYWTDELQAMFAQATGCDLDLRSPENATLALIARGGSLLLEQHGGSQLTYRYTLEDGTPISLKSSEDNKTDPGAIRVNHKTMTKGQGLQIVVYDNELRCPIDCVCIQYREPEDEPPEVVIARKDATVFSMMSTTIADYAYEVIASM